MNIPNFQDIPFVVKRGDQYYLSDQWRILMQQLFSELQIGGGPEGLVAPTLSSAANSVDPATAGGEVTQVQNNSKIIGGETTYSCQFGTIIYDSNTNEMKMAVDDGAGAPLFRVVTLV